MRPRIWKSEGPLQSVIGNSTNDTSRKGGHYGFHSKQNQAGHGRPVEYRCHSSSCNKSTYSFKGNLVHSGRHTYAAEAFGDLRIGYWGGSQSLLKVLSKKCQNPILSLVMKQVKAAKSLRQWERCIGVLNSNPIQTAFREFKSESEGCQRHLGVH